MLDKAFEEDGFIIDLSNAKDASEIVYELTTILEMPEAKCKKICLKLGCIDLSQSQLLSIKSLMTSMDSPLEIVDTDSEKTESSAIDLGLTVTKFANKIEVQELEQSDLEIKEMEVGEPKDGLSYELIENPLVIEEETATIIEEVVKDEGIIEEPEQNIVEPEADIKSEEEAISLEEISKLPTFYLQQNLRSGQTMSYDGNVVLIGDAKPGSEIIAKGDITVWGVLGGIAHAGARGNDYAKIRALKIHAIQLRISGFYARRPDSINIPFIQRANTFTPEEARVSNGEIAIYKICE